ncbi:MAG: membrane protein insertase YidC [Bacteroidales bacterium]|nr:membrane protein insertase YidC [Bacteroidales bacterium]
MNRSSITGFVLIGIVLLLFSWYNTKQFEKQQAAAYAADSVARAEALKYLEEEALAASAVDTASAASELDSVLFSRYRTRALALAAGSAAEEKVTLSNEDVQITFSTKGGQPQEVLLKKFFRHDSTALYLMPQGSSSFDVELDAGQYINTTDLNYRVVSSGPRSVTLRLDVDDDAYIDNVYSIAESGYTVDLAMRFVGMERFIPRSSSQCRITWKMDVPRLEKGYTNEKNYSSLGYCYMGSEDVKQISLRKDGGREQLAGNTEWVAFKQQFFSAILYSQDGFVSGEVAANSYPETDAAQRLMACQAVLDVQYGEKTPDFTKSFQFNFTPNHYPILKGYDRKYDKLLPLGGWLVGSVNRYVIIPIFNWLNKSISNYGIIILILTLIIKLVISPLTLRSYTSSAKMKVLKPEIDKINAKYSKEADAMKKQQATMDLYKKSGVSIYGGCLPILLQFPILYAMFRFFPSSFELRQQSFLWAHDLSTYDSILEFGFNIPLYGNHISLFALLMGITMFFYSKMTMGTMDTGQQMPGMKFMQVWFMPIFMVLLCNNFSAGLSYYYMLSNLITIVQNWVIRKWFVDEEKIMAQIKAKTAAEKSGPAKKSKFQMRLEEAQKTYQQQQKQNGRK